MLILSIPTDLGHKERRYLYELMGNPRLYLSFCIGHEFYNAVVTVTISHHIQPELGLVTNIYLSTLLIEVILLRN